MSKLLLHDHPLMVMPKLAEAIGLNEALVLQQVHYWINHYQGKADQAHFIDDEWWVYNTPKGWKEDNFPFWSESTIRRAFENLRDMGLIKVGQFNKAQYDRTLWYTIDYTRLAELETSIYSSLARRCAQNEQMDDSKMSTPIPETTTETTHKHTPANADETETLPPVPEQTPEQELDAFGLGNDYREKFGAPDPKPPRAWSERARDPWLDWSGGLFHEREGVSVDAQDRVAWLVEHYGKLRPAGSHSGWQCGAIAAYKAGRGDWATIEAGIAKAFAREARYRPKTLACSPRTADQNGVVKAVAAEWAERHQDVITTTTPTAKAAPENYLVPVPTWEVQRA